MQKMDPNDRRSFLKKSALLTASLGLAKFTLASAHTSKSIQTIKTTTAAINLPQGSIALFQGDSITDGGRGHNFDWNHVLGQDYAYLIASRLWYDNPKMHWQFFNRGISGNKVTDLLQRWQKDTLDIKPDILTILVGVNDTQAEINGDKNFTAASYERDYQNLLKITKEAFPKVRLIICEPFILPVGKVKQDWQRWLAAIVPRQKIVKALAKEHSALFIPFQSHFNNALAKAPADYWIWDGVHPMPAGHEMMARVWIDLVK